MHLRLIYTPIHTKCLLKKCGVFNCAVCHPTKFVSTDSKMLSKELSVFVIHVIYHVVKNVDKNSLVKLCQKNISKIIHA